MATYTVHTSGFPLPANCISSYCPSPLLFPHLAAPASKPCICCSLCLEHMQDLFPHLFQVFAKMSSPERDLLSPTGDARPSTPCLLSCFIFLHCHYHYLADMVFDLLGLLWPSLVPLDCQLRRARTFIHFVHCSQYLEEGQSLTSEVSPNLESKTSIRDIHPFN